MKTPREENKLKCSQNMNSKQLIYSILYKQITDSMHAEK